MIHYRAGCNWNYESLDFYKAKIDRMLKRYLPDLEFNFDDVGGSLKDTHGNILT
jgi:hypothetical protein